MFRLGGVEHLGLINWDAQAVSQELRIFLPLVQLAHVKQVCELLDDGDGVRDAAGPECVPDAVNLGFRLPVIMVVYGSSYLRHSWATSVVTHFPG